LFLHLAAGNLYILRQLEEYCMSGTGKTAQLLLATVLLVSFWPQSILAQPVISGVGGNVEHGETLQLTGLDFGAGSTILAWDDFESGTVGTPLDDQYPVAGYQWGVLWRHWDNDPEHDIIYSNVNSYSGLQSARVWWKRYSMLAMGWANRGPFPEFYMSFLRYHDPRNPDGSPYTGCPDGFNFKLFYWYSNSSPQEMFRTMAILDNCGGWAMNFSSGIPGRNGNIDFLPGQGLSYAASTFIWQRWEIYQKQESSPPNSDDGEVECTIDFEERIDASGLNTTSLSGDQSWWTDLRLGHMHQGYQSCVARSYYDDVFMATSRARVELGDQPVFSQCTKRDIQYHVDWSGGEIDFVLHCPSFSPDEEAYLFVVDRDGVASPGFPVTIGGTSEPPSDGVPPTVTIDTPTLPLGTPAPHYVSCYGSAADNIAVTEVTWVNSLGGQGVAQGTIAWSISNIQLHVGDNVITITAHDTAGNEGFSQILIPWDFPSAPGTPKTDGP